MEEMTIENLLMMETCHNMTTYKKTSTTENWVRSFFQTIPTHRPGTLFMYDTSASHVLCALVEKLTGQKLLDYLKDQFLRTIGFSEESYIMADPFGVSMGGTGLMAKPVDMLRVGLMMLNRGIHPDDYGKENGRQIYPKEYLEKAQMCIRDRYSSEVYRQAIQKYHIHQSMNSAGGRCHDNARCESMWARMKTELLYDRYDTKQMTVEELKILIWRYFLSYWNNRRICSANGGLPPMIKRRQYYETLELAA